MMWLKIARAFLLVAVGAGWFYETFSISTKKTPTLTTVIQTNRHRPWVPPTTVCGCLGLAGVAIHHLVMVRDIVKEMVEAEVASAA